VDKEGYIQILKINFHNFQGNLWIWIKCGIQLWQEKPL